MAAWISDSICCSADKAKRLLAVSWCVKRVLSMLGSADETLPTTVSVPSFSQPYTVSMSGLTPWRNRWWMVSCSQPNAELNPHPRI